MQKSLSYNVKKAILGFIFILFFLSGFGQNQNNVPSEFWSKVQFGGGIGLSFGNGYTDVALAPSAIYNVSEIVAVGTGFHISYIESKGLYSSFVYGLNAILLVSPIPQIQFSVALSESNVNYDYNEYGYENYSENYWVTGLVLGVGYRTGNVTIGVGYNVIQDPYYDEPFIPFVRAYF